MAMRKIIFLLPLSVFFISSFFSAGSYAGSHPWTAYFGTHYMDAEWAKSVRDPVGPAIAGFWPDSRQRHPELDKRFDELLSDLEHRLSRQDVVLGVGGLGSGRRSEEVDAFMDMVKKDNANRWKDELHRRVVRVARLKHASERVYWQFGNEINGPRFLRNMVEWEGGTAQQRGIAMSRFIPLYVEYFLAPGVEAIQKSSRDAYGKEGQIRIMLGSLANARHPRSISWYRQLLDYEIKGTYAPTLRGRRVFQIVDTLSIHYLLTAPDDYWAEELDKLSRSYMGRGAVRRIWSTEEIGIRRAREGHGAATALQVWARSLWWWEKYLWKPEHGRVFFWGWNIGDKGSRAEDSLSTIFSFTGDRALNYVGTVKGDAAVEYAESYVFRTKGKLAKKVAVVLPKGREATISLKRLSLPAVKSRGRMNISAHIFSPAGTKTLEVKARHSGSALDVTLSGAGAQLQSGSALLLLIE